MKVRIEIAEGLAEDEVVLRCGAVTDRIKKVQRALAEIAAQDTAITCYKEQPRPVEFYIPAREILFFETAAELVYAHTADDVYRVKFRLYALENMLPRDFIRISKSTIVNVGHILSIDRSLTASSLIRFHKSHKQVYASRHYFKALRQRMDAPRA